MSEKSPTTIERPPIIAIMGHVDHGKSTLLDYIRNTNIVATEAGGITQAVSAYEVEHTDPHGVIKKITFIDTPGHAAFSGMRQRGATIADIAILIVAADDSVKTQTIEAIQIIKESAIPYMVVINKIDKPGADAERVKTDLMSHDIFLEGYGGDIPYVAVSAKTGAGIDTLLETLLLLAEMHEFTGDPMLPAEGYIVESHLDAKRGFSATLVIKNGTLKRGEFITAGCGMATTRIMENFMGVSIDEATFSAPIRITGFSTQCSAGSSFTSYTTKKEAEDALGLAEPESYLTHLPADLNTETTTIVPIILKCDVEGMIEAVAGAIEKLSHGTLYYKIIKSGVGIINESDIRLAASDAGTIIVGFNVKQDKGIERMNEYEGITIASFSIIYKLVEWLETLKEERRFRQNVDTVLGSLTILKVFGGKKTEHVIGGRTHKGDGMLSIGNKIKLLRAGQEIARGKILEIQIGKSANKTVAADTECGMKIEVNADVAEGDVIEAFQTVIQ